MLKDRGVAGDDIAMLERIVARINFEYKDTDAQLLANAARAAGATGALGRVVEKLSVITPEDVFNSAMFKALGREGALRARVGAAAAQSRLSIDDDEYAKLFGGFELALKTSLCRCTNVRCLHGGICFSKAENYLFGELSPATGDTAKMTANTAKCMGHMQVWLFAAKRALFRFNLDFNLETQG
jgi:hypothetical protein